LHGLHFLVVGSDTELGRWTHIDDHLFSALAKHSIGMQLVEEAVDFYVRLLGNQARAPPHSSSTALRTDMCSALED